MIDSPALLLLLLAALIAVPLLLRRLKAASPEGVRVVGRTALSKGAVVAVVAVGDRRLLVGAGERGVQLIAELDAEPVEPVVPSASTPRTSPATAVDLDVLLPMLDRTDAAAAGTSSTIPDDASEALAELDLQGSTSEGPGNGLVDRLRAMTVRTPVQGRPFHAPLRR